MCCFNLLNVPGKQDLHYVNFPKEKALRYFQQSQTLWLTVLCRRDSKDFEVQNLSSNSETIMLSLRLETPTPLIMRMVITLTLNSFLAFMTLYVIISKCNSYVLRAVSFPLLFGGSSALIIFYLKESHFI